MMECKDQHLVLEQIGNDHYFYNEAIKTCGPISSSAEAASRR